MKLVWLGGEGNCELGSLPESNERRGAIEALLRRKAPEGWTVAGATRWKSIRKYTARRGIEPGENHGDTRNVLGLVLEAKEKGYTIVAFTRDIDADDEREAAVHLGIHKAAELFPGVEVIGGVAKPAVEGWILACRGEARTDDMSRRKTLDLLAKHEIVERNAEAYVAVVENADLNRLPNGCTSLQDRLALATQILTPA